MAWLILGVALMSMTFGPMGALLPGLFPESVRYTGSGISHNVSSIPAAAVAPFIAVALRSAAGGRPVLVGLYLSAMAGPTLLALLDGKETKDIDIEAQAVDPCAGGVCLAVASGGTGMTEVWIPVGGPGVFAPDDGGTDIQAKLVRYAAARRGLAIEDLGEGFSRFTFGAVSHTFFGAMPDTTTLVGRRITGSKQVTKTVLRGAGLPVPRGDVFARHDKAGAWRFARALGLPVVVKPIRGSGGRGVTPGIGDETLFDLAWAAASSEPRIVVEEMIRGRDYRLLVVGDTLVLASWRQRPALVGDGSSTIAALVAAQNRSRADNPLFGAKPVALTPTMLHRLAREGLAADSIPEGGRRVLLTLTANTVLGGANLDVTDEVHPGFAALAVAARRAIPGVFHVGVDLLAADIRRPPGEQEHAICEVNSAPDLAFHHFPIAGPARDAAGTLLEGLFPGALPVPPGQWARVRLDDAACPPRAVHDLWRLAALHAVAGRIELPGPRGLMAELCGPWSALDAVVDGLRGAHPSTDLTVRPSSAPLQAVLTAAGFPCGAAVPRVGA